MNKPIRTIVVDDSIIFRKVVRDCLKKHPRCEVIDVAKDGAAAIEKIRQHKPDLVTLDYEMPVMNGLDVLQAIQDDDHRPRTILLSAHATGQRGPGADVVGRAIALGADDYLLKPDGNCSEENFRFLEQQLFDKVAAITKILEKQSPQPTPRNAHQSTAKPEIPTRGPFTPAAPIDAVCIGISTGGPASLTEIMPQFDRSFPVPIFIVQHMPAGFTEGLASHLDSLSPLSVCEAEHGMAVRPGHVYIAPGGRHMGVRKVGGAATIEVNSDPPIRSCRPSVDHLFQTAAAAYRKHALGVVMTGMGHDGAEGSSAIRASGGRVWTQTADSCVVYGMPRAVVESGASDLALPLNQIVSELTVATSKAKLPRMQVTT